MRPLPMVQAALPPPLPQAAPTVVNTPPAPAWTQLPLVKLLEEIEPITVKALPGVVVPMPTLPKAVTLKMEVLVDEDTSKGSTVPEPLTAKVVIGAVEPRPKLPELLITDSTVPALFWSWNKSEVWVEEAWRIMVGLEVEEYLV